MLHAAAAECLPGVVVLRCIRTAYACVAATLQCGPVGYLVGHVLAESPRGITAAGWDVWFRLLSILRPT